MAVTEELRVEIQAEVGRATRKMRDFQGATKQTSAAAGKLGKVLKRGLGAAAAAVSIGALTKAMNSSIQAFRVQEEAEAQLRGALLATGKASGGTAEELQRLASELQGVTTFGDEATIKATALLQSLGDLESDGLKSIIPLVQDFATGMGMDLTNAAQLVGKTLGSSTNALSRYGIVIDATAPKQQKLEQLTGALQEKFGGLSKEMANTASGSLTQLGNAFGDLQETLGERLLNSMDGIIGKLTEFIGKANEAAAGANALQLALSGEDQGLDPAARLENQRLAVEQLQRQIEAARESADDGIAGGVRLAQLEKQLEKEAEMLQRLETRRDVYGDLERAAERGAAAQEAEAEAVDAVTQRYLETRATVVDTLHQESAALAEVRAKIAQLEASPWASGQYEEDRLEALERLRAKEEEILIQEGKLIDAQEILGTARQTTGEIFAEEQQRIIDQDKKLEEQANQTAQAIASSYTSNVAPVFEAFGEAIVKQGEAWKALGATAVEAIAGILRALGQQFAAEAAGALARGILGDPTGFAAAAQYGAASALAFTASGIVSGLADNIRSAATGADFVTNGPQLMMVGDNPSGREHVKVEPNGGGSDGPMGGDVYLDGRKVGEWIQSQTSKGQIRIAERAVV